MWRVLYWNPWGQFYRTRPGLEVGCEYRDNDRILVLGRPSLLSASTDRR